MLIKLRDCSMRQIASLEPAWLVPWWSDGALLPFEEKNEFELTYEGKPCKYKCDIPPGGTIGVSLCRVQGVLRVILSQTFPPGSDQLGPAGIWLALPGFPPDVPPVPTPEPSPVPLPVRPKSITFCPGGVSGAPAIVWWGDELVVTVSRSDFDLAYDGGFSYLLEALVKKGE